MLYFWIRIVSMVRALPLRWCKSTLPRFSESILFETCVPLTFDGIYNSKFTQYLLILSASDILRIFPTSLLSFVLWRVQSRRTISFAMIAISRWFIILFCILMQFGTFCKYITITKQKQDWWYTTHKFPSCISFIWLPLNFTVFFFNWFAM